MLLRVFSGSGVARSSEDGIAFNGRTGNKVPSSKTTPFFDLHSDSVHVHEKSPPFSEADKRAPGKPTGVTVAPYETGRNARETLEISWTANPNGNKAITNHEIEWSPDGTADSWKDLRTVSGGRTETLFTGLSPGTTRHIRIRSSDNDGDSEWSDVKSGTTNAAGKPGTPSSLTETVTGPSTVDLSWTAPDDGGSPILRYEIVAFTPPEIITPSYRNENVSPTTSYTVTGLTAATQYIFRIRAVNAIGKGNRGQFSTNGVTTAAAGKPGTPSSLTETVTGPSTVDLSWTAPDDGGSPILRYEIVAFTPPEIITPSYRNENVSPTTSYTVTGLTAATQYIFRIRAVNAIGKGNRGQFSTNGVTTAALTAPAAPTGLTATAAGRTTINLSWTAPSDNGGAAITGYRIESRLRSETSFSTLVANTKSTDTKYSHTGLAPSTQRFYRVSAINSEGPGTASNVDDATTAAATRPSAPRNLTATASGRSTINLSWTAPSDNGGSAITFYRVGVSTDEGKNWNRLTDVRGATTYSHTGLSAGTRRDYRVVAANSSGRGFSDRSNEAHATTDPATAPGAPRNVAAAADGQTVINLSWEAPADNGGRAITGYRVQWSSNGNAPWTNVTPAHTGTDRTYRHTGLSAGMTRHYRVFALNSVGESTRASAVATATTVAAPTLSAPAAPTGLTATAEGPETISLFWNAPTNTGGAAITGYQIEVSPTGTGETTWTNLVEDTKSTKTTYTHTGLDAGTTRHYRVRAINSEGAGAASSTDDATTLPATVPAAPTDLSATADGATTINLSWNAPTNTGGVPLTGYQMEVSPNGNTWTPVTPAHTGTGRTYSHTGLTAGTTRYYRVYARNAKGLGAASNTANATTSAATATAPGAPTGLTATASGQTTINLSWTAPTNTGGAAITGYQIEVSPNGSDTWTNLETNTGTTATTYAHTGLTAGTTRHYRVRAINSVDPGAASNVVSATTSLPAATAPGAPTGLTASASGPTTINLSWTAPSNNGGAAITGYRVDVSPNGTDNWTELVVNTGTTYTHSGLDANTTRHYRVRAINSVGPGPVSTAANATTGAATAPGAPTSLTATADGQTTINLRWTAPTNTGGTAITGYRVEVSPNGTDNWNNLVANTAATTYAHTGLSAGVTRYYRVRAINVVGTGNPSTIANATTSTPTATAPGAPTSLTATAAGRTIINLSWTAPTESGGAAITGYRVEVSPTGTGDTWDDLVANIAATTYSHTGLSAGVTRYYRVRALNAVGASDASTIANATTDGRTVPSVPTSLMATASGQTIINLRWAVPADNGGAAVTGYQVEVSEDAGSTWMDLVANTTATTYSHTGLPPETTRHYRVRAINAVGTGAASNVASATTEAATVLSFAGAISSQRYPVDLAIAALVLPTAIGGTPPYTYALSPETLPEGLSLEDGTLGGTPTAVTASQGFTWTVTDALGATMTMEFTLEIYEITFVTTVMNQSYDRGQLIDPLVLPEVTGGTDPVRYTLNLLSLPSGLRFDASTRTIAGTPVQITPPVELTYKATDAKGAQASVTFTLEVVSPVATEEQKEYPRELVVHANYPNPFRTSTNLLFDLPWPAEIKLDVLDLTGRRVYTHPMVRMAAGREQVITLEQVALPAGVYLYRMVATSMEHGTSAVKVGHLMRMR